MIRDTIRVCMRRAIPLLAVAGLTLLPLGAVVVLCDIGFGVAESLRPLLSDGHSWVDDAGMLGGVGILVAVVCVVAAFVAPLGVGAMIAIGAGEGVGIRAALRSAWTHYEGLLVTVVAAAVAPVAVFAGVVALAVALHVRYLFVASLLVVLSLRLVLAPVAVMLEGLGPVDALRRSWDLTEQRARAQRLTLLVLVLGIGIGGAAIAAVGVPPMFVPDFVVSLRLGEASGALVGSVLSPVAVVTLTLLYLRWRPATAAPPVAAPLPVVSTAEHLRWSQWVSTYVSDPARRPAALTAALRTMAAGGSSEQAANAAWSAAWS